MNNNLEKRESIINSINSELNNISQYNLGGKRTTIDKDFFINSVRYFLDHEENLTNKQLTAINNLLCVIGSEVADNYYL